MEASEVHILIQQSWQLFGTFTFKDDVLSTARRFNMFFASLRQSAKQFRLYFPGLPWCLRMEDGELTGRRHFHFLLAGFHAQSIHFTTCYWMTHKWEELGGGMARVRQFNPGANRRGLHHQMFYDIGHAPADHSNRRNTPKDYAVWEIHPVMKIEAIRN